MRLARFYWLAFFAVLVSFGVQGDWIVAPVAHKELARSVDPSSGSSCTDLTMTDVQLLVKKLLREHVCVHKLDVPFMRRVVSNFLEELDPNKTYWILEDVNDIASISDAQVLQIISTFERGTLPFFEKTYARFREVVAQRRLPSLFSEAKAVEEDGDMLEDLESFQWAASLDALNARLARVCAWRILSTKAIDPNNGEDLLLMVERRTQNRENKIINATDSQARQAVYRSFLKAMAQAADSQTMYFPPAEASRFLSQVQGRIFGIGVVLEGRLNGLIIRSVIEGGPVWTQGLQLREGDRIVAVDDQVVTGMDLNEAVELIRGPEGSKVRLAVARMGCDEHSEEFFDVQIFRGEVVLDEERLRSDYRPYGDGIIAVLQLKSFYQDEKASSAKDMLAAFRELEKNGRIEGVVLDLRGNMGGLLSQAVEVAGLFLRQGVVVSTKDGRDDLVRFRNFSSVPMWDGPLLILVDRYTASASEILAQTLKEFGVGLVVGDESTFGKGTFQAFPVEFFHGKGSNKGELKVTRGRYYTVSGLNLQGEGVLADILMPSYFAHTKIGERYSKNPLPQGESIAPAFEDPFDDISAWQRMLVKKNYNDLQKVSLAHRKHLPLLQEHAAEWIASQPIYNDFCQQGAADPELAIRSFVELDFPLEGTLRLLKELILLWEEGGAEQESACAVESYQECA